MHSSIEPATQAPRSARPARAPRLATGLLISLVTLSLCLGSLELTGYLWERSTAQGPNGWTLVASRRMPLVRRGSESRPFYVLEPESDYNWEGVPVHINSRGFRTEEFETPKPDSIYRILNLGDSIVFGWEVRQEDTYGKQLERILNAKEDTRRYEVINAGIPAWTLESARNFLLEEGLSYGPDLVVLDITVVNDIYGRSPGESEEQTLLQWLRDNTHAWPFLTTQARFLLSRQRGPEAIPVLNPPRHAESYYPLDEDNAEWDRVWGYVTDMFGATTERGIRFVLVVFPTAFQLNSSAHPSVPQKVLKKRASAAGVTFVDLMPTYRQACAMAAADACEGLENLLFADVWMHPNNLGHLLAAEELAPILEGQLMTDLLQ